MLQRPSSKYMIVLLVIALVASYAYYEMRGYIHGPQLIITSPADGFSVQDETLTLTGTSRNITDITLNGKAIFIDEVGAFSEDVLLLSGYNVLTLAVTDRYGRTNVQYIRGVYTPPLGSDEDFKPQTSDSLKENGAEEPEENKLGDENNNMSTSSTSTIQTETTL